MKRLAFALVLLLATLGVAELVAGFVAPSADGDDLLVPHARRAWALQPGERTFAQRVATVGDDGLRITTDPAKTGAPLVLLLGDSSMFSHGVPDGRTLHDRLQIELRQRGVEAQVVCAAVPGYSLLQTRRLMDELWGRDPALLVVGNLWSDNNARGQRDAELLATFDQPAVRAQFLLRRSALFRALSSGLQEPSAAPQVGWTETSEVGLRRLSIEEYAQNLDGLLQDASDHGTGALLLALSNREIEEHGRTPDQSWTPFFEVQEAVGRARGVPRVDAHQAFRKTDGRSPFTDMMHPGDYGMELLGRALAERLVEEGWPQTGLVPAPSATLPALPEDPFDGHIEVPPDDMIRGLLDAGGVSP